MKPTIDDVAKASGYSKTSVSFAFNDPSRLSAAALEKILDAAEHLGYVPDPLARNLTTRKAGSIGFVLPQALDIAFDNPYIYQIMRGVGMLCEKAGYALTLIPPVQGRMFEGVRGAAVEGFITLGVVPGMAVVELIRRRHIPFVTIDGVASEGIAGVNIDDHAAARAATAHILSLGHTRIGVLSFETVSGTDESRYSGIGEARVAGIQEAVSGSTVELAIVECECSLGGGRGAAVEMLAAAGRPTAVVAMSDIMAIGVYQAAAELGIRIPQDLSVVGFDDIPEATLVSPRLSTVGQPGFEKGWRAGRMLFDLIEGRDIPMQQSVASRLIVRDSTAAPGI